jgi:hypothetical protein
MGTASVPTPKLNGHLKTNLLPIMMQCYLTYLLSDAFHPKKGDARYNAAVELFLESEIYAHILSHLMGNHSALHGEIVIFMVFQFKATITCLLIRRTETSQLLN